MRCFKERSAATTRVRVMRGSQVGILILESQSKPTCRPHARNPGKTEGSAHVSGRQTEGVERIA
jgi:hypothetical protein